ncbi:MAG: flavodoxin-dependent (E)-4-hydroxy-3-methylbut-2-enyl-diphosphate synthase, partial [Planctomycetes bacterium]|nr:flavodoxin-dependent (E)-4-hydroxy-3-methylbut-2-enyl-diphosphate synthase [Planctomycetota bacterium]
DHIDALHYHRRSSETVLIQDQACGDHHHPLVFSNQQDSTDLAADVQWETGAEIFTTVIAGDSITQSAQLIMLDCDQDNIADGLRHTLNSAKQASVFAISACGAIGASRCYRLLHAIIEDLHLASPSLPRHSICIHLLDDTLLSASSICGTLFADGIGDAIYLPYLKNSVSHSFAILQAMKMRMSKTDYVACPSCGRTLFDLMEVSAQIKELTDHLKGVTIAIMGCIVNGPGEMADADFGYVGSGPGKITLYQGQDPVLKNIAADDAPHRLVALIKEAGRWVER